MWPALVGMVLGVVALPDVSPTMMVALVSVGGVLVLARWPFAGVVGLVLLATAAGALTASRRAPEPAPLEALAAEVARCDLGGRIVEGAGGLGTLVRVDRAECDGRPPIEEAGAGFLDGPVGDAGGSFAAEGWVLPLGDDSFGRARARLGGHAAIRTDRLSTQPPRGGPLAAAAAVRRGLDDATASLEPRRAGLIRGLTIGDTSGLDSFTTESFRRAGLAHLVAVSGLHVTIVIGAILVALGRIGLVPRVAVAVAGLALYVLVVGPRPSVLRASVMGTISLAALVAGHRSHPLRALGLALLLLVALRPAMVHSVGLHLSAAATAGIIFWAGALARWTILLPRPLALVLAATLSAQFAVAPILAGVFGLVSLSAPAANVMAMPAVAPAIVLGLTSGVAAIFLPPAGVLLARAAEPFAGWILAAGDLFGPPRWAALEVPGWWGWILAVPVAAAAARAWRRA